MAYVPWAFREKEPCKHCGTKSYVHPHITDLGLFCSETCATTFKWRKKFNYHARDPQQFPRSNQ